MARSPRTSRTVRVRAASSRCAAPRNSVSRAARSTASSTAAEARFLAFETLLKASLLQAIIHRVCGKLRLINDEESFNAQGMEARHGRVSGGVTHGMRGGASSQGDAG